MLISNVLIMKHTELGFGIIGIKEKKGLVSVVRWVIFALKGIALCHVCIHLSDTLKVLKHTKQEHKMWDFGSIQRDVISPTFN